MHTYINIYVADKWSQHLWGRCIGDVFGQAGEKERPGTFGKIRAG